MGIRVNHAQLQNASDDMGTASKKIDQRLERLEKDLEQLSNNEGWTGEAQQTYLAAKAKWDQQIRELNIILLQAGGQVATSQGEYAAADKKGAAGFQF